MRVKNANESEVEIKMKEKMKENIVLIGMPAVGKSTAGVQLAKLLGYEFIDSDLVIQKETGRLLHDIIREDGIDRFIEIENQVNSHLDTQHSVIATGGSVVYGAEAMEHLQKIGTIVYLKVSFDILKERLSDTEERGVVFKPGQDLYDLYLERTALYEKYAQITIDEEGMDAEQTILTIQKELGLS